MRIIFKRTKMMLGSKLTRSVRSSKMLWHALYQHQQQKPIFIMNSVRNFGLEKEYDPVEEQLQMKFHELRAAMVKIDRKDESDLLHGEDGGMIYKYDLPVVNQPIVFHNKLIVVDEEKEALT